jgi:hypothetical protein
VLERAGIVCGARDGKRVLFRLCREKPHVDGLIVWAVHEAETMETAPRVRELTDGKLSARTRSARSDRLSRTAESGPPGRIAKSLLGKRRLTPARPDGGSSSAMRPPGRSDRALTSGSGLRTGTPSGIGANSTQQTLPEPSTQSDLEPSSVEQSDRDSVAPPRYLRQDDFEDFLL